MSAALGPRPSLVPGTDRNRRREHRKMHVTAAFEWPSRALSVTQSQLRRSSIFLASAAIVPGGNNSTSPLSRKTS